VHAIEQLLARLLMILRARDVGDVSASAISISISISISTSISISISTSTSRSSSSSRVFASRRARAPHL